jgi:hypothetical protein
MESTETEKTFKNENAETEKNHNKRKKNFCFKNKREKFV